MIRSHHTQNLWAVRVLFRRERPHRLPHLRRPQVHPAAAPGSGRRAPGGSGDRPHRDRAPGPRTSSEEAV